MGEQHCLGFVGFDAVHQHHEFTPQELQLLHLFATLLAHLRDRQHMESELSRERSFLKTLEGLAEFWFQLNNPLMRG
jgi:GAF domain-containing protein